MKNRATANAINGDSVNQVRLTGRLPSTYSASKETKGVGLYGGVSEPSNIGPNVAGLVDWQQSYGTLWELKLSFEKKYNR